MVTPASKRKFKFILILLLVILISIPLFLLNWSYSEGSRSGRLVKLSQKGILFKEWEGTLDLGGGYNLTWNFSVHDDDLGEELMGKIGDLVTLNYEEHLVRFIYDTKYEVTSWRAMETDSGAKDQVAKAKICPFLYLLRDDPDTLNKAAQLIKAKRRDLATEVDNCLKQIQQF